VSATGLIFLSAFILGCMLALSRHAIYGVMTYVIVVFVSPGDRWWGQDALGDIRWSLVAAIVTLAALLLHRPVSHATPFWRQPFVIGVLAFLFWLLMQSLWALSPVSHSELTSYYVKYVVAIGLLYLSLDRPEHVRLFMWAYFIGCCFLAWVSYTSFAGGRFDSFGGASINDANTGALVTVTGLLVAVGLLLAEKGWLRVTILLAAPFMVNSLVATESRTGFLALVGGMGTFFMLGTRRTRKFILMISALGLVLFVALSNAAYWERIGTIAFMGKQVEGLDTGHKRLLLIQAQWRMFKLHPLGCGSRCTDVLSGEFLDSTQLTGHRDEEKARSSHNTPMTMLVEHGVPGAAFYLLMLLWVLRSVQTMRRYAGSEMIGFAPEYLPAVAGVFVSILIADQFVQMPKLEPRLWFATVLMVMLELSTRQREARHQAPQDLEVAKC